MVIHSENRLKISNLITAVNQVQNTFQRLVEAHLAISAQDLANSIENDLQAYILNTVLAVENIFQSQNKNPAHLPIRSRRAYQWLKFLSDQNRFKTHLKALTQIVQTGRVYSKQSIQFNFYHIGPIYKVEKNNEIRLTAQESFITAPDAIFNILIQTALSRPAAQDRLKIRDYTMTKAYCQLREELEYLMIPRNSFAAGEFWNLETVFYRVNQKYFGGQISKPHLVWSSRPTRRKFGHYQQDIQTIMISSSLDKPHIPSEVLDYVMYHELLHIHLGVKRTKQRRYVHTTEFKKRESAFSDFEFAKAYLEKLSIKG
jgi:hypothetical protein